METIPQSSDFLVVEAELVRASTGKRFLNYLIDIIFFYLLFFIAGIVIALTAPETIDSLANDTGFGLGERLLTLLFYAVYMSVVEALFKGKSLGKLITGTRAVYEDGNRISIGTAFGRGFARAVPFCVFSALGTPCIPWQDKWTNTMVIDEKQSQLP